MKKLTRIWILAAALIALLCGAVCAAEDDGLVAHSRQTYLASVPMADADEALLQKAEAAILAGFRDRSNPVEHDGKTYYRTAFFESPFAWPGSFTDAYCDQLFNLFCRTLFDHPQEGYDIFTEVYYYKDSRGIAIDFLHVTDGTQDAAFDAAVSDAVLDCFGPYWGRMTDLEKAALCYSYVIGKVTYSTAYATDTKEPFTPYGALMNGKAVCQGYTQLYKLLLDVVGFDGDNCIVTTGTANGGNHAWNLVKLDDVWYHVDPTWGDGYALPGVVIWDYFLRSDDEIRAQNHTEWNVTDEGHACPQSFTGKAFWKYQEDGKEKVIRSPLFASSWLLCYATDYDMWYSEAGTDFSGAKCESWGINGFISGTAAAGAVFYADAAGDVYMYLPLYGSNTKIEEASGLTGWVYMDSDPETLHLYTWDGKSESDAVRAKDVAITETTDRSQPVQFVQNRFVPSTIVEGIPIYIRTAPTQKYCLVYTCYNAAGQMIDWSVWSGFEGNGLFIPDDLDDACTELRFFALDAETGRPLSESLLVQRQAVLPQAAA